MSVKSRKSEQSNYGIIYGVSRTYELRLNSLKLFLLQPFNQNYLSPTIAINAIDFKQYHRASESNKPASVYTIFI